MRVRISSQMSGEGSSGRVALNRLNTFMGGIRLNTLLEQDGPALSIAYPPVFKLPRGHGERYGSWLIGGAGLIRGAYDGRAAPGQG
jgi:hypothetical protein